MVRLGGLYLAITEFSAVWAYTPGGLCVGRTAGAAECDSALDGTRSYPHHSDLFADGRRGRTTAGGAAMGGGG